MPKFISAHVTTQITRQQIEQLVKRFAEAASGGIRNLRLQCNTIVGRMICEWEAPDADALMEWLESLNVRFRGSGEWMMRVDVEAVGKATVTSEAMEVVAAPKDEITAAALREKMECDEDFVLLDVRSEEEFERWQIEGRRTPQTVNVPYHLFLEKEKASLAQVPPDTDVVVVCAVGGASANIARLLRERGYRAVNLSSGIVGWGQHYAFRPVAVENDFTIHQVDRVGKGCLSYVLIADGQMIVVDPSRHVDEYVRFAKEQGVAITHVFDTHAHADHISGGGELSQRTEARYFLHPYDAIHPMDVLPATIHFAPCWDGQTFQVGPLKVQVIHTPGHTLGIVSLLVNNRYLFTGDTLFINSFGRPDLGGQGEAWSHVLYRTLRKLRANLPDGVLILPGHYSDHREANAQGLFATTLGDLRRNNEGLTPRSEEEFVRYVLAHLPQFPSEYVDIKRINLGLLNVDEEKATELELGKNVCALSKNG